MGGRGTVVLVVEADAEERERLGSLLEEGRMEVLACPGPTGPDYVCFAGRGQPCPLVGVADVVVLDLWLESYTVMAGTSAEELLAHYLSSGKRVVTLGRRGASLEPYPAEEVVGLTRYPGREELIGAVRRVRTQGPGFAKGNL